MKYLLLTIALFAVISCSKNTATPNQQPTVFISSVSTAQISEPGGAQSLQITYNVNTVIPSLQLFRDTDNLLMENDTQVSTGKHITYDRNDYIRGAKYHFLVNNSIEIDFIAN